MKVLYVGADAIACGAGYSMLKLIEELDAFDDVELVPVVHKGNTESLLTEKGRSHYVVSPQSLSISNRYPKPKRAPLGIAKSIMNIPCYFQYKKILKKENPDLVHINALTVSTVAKAAYKLGIPVVWHIRELLEEDLNSTFWRRKKTYSQMKKADMFIAISDCVKNKYLPIVGEDHIRRIYNGVDKELFYRPDHRVLKGDKTVITMAGRIIREKGQYQCLESLLPVLKEHPGLVLRFAGTGADSELEKIKALAEPVKDQVELLGFVKDMPRLWEQTDIAVVYSKFEAFGRVTVEAKMAGALVVGYNSGGTAELIDDGADGYLFDDQKPLKKVVEQVLDRPEEARSVASRGREKAAETFTSENNARAVRKLYGEVLEKRGAQPKAAR